MWLKVYALRSSEQVRTAINEQFGFIKGEKTQIAWEFYQKKEFVSAGIVKFYQKFAQKHSNRKPWKK